MLHHSHDREKISLWHNLYDSFHNICGVTKVSLLVQFFWGFVWLLCNSIPWEAPEGIITQSLVWASRWPVKWSGQHWRPMADPAITGNFTRVFSNSKCVMCWWFVQLERGLTLSIQNFQFCHDTVFRHVQARVLINL